MKKLLIIFFMLVIAFVMVGCSSENNNEYYKWNNYEAVYVTIDDNQSNDVFLNINKSFEKYQYKKAYIVNKKIDNNCVISLTILFVIDDNLDKFIANLKEDPNIKSYEICKDLPYESIDNRYFEYENNTIKVGDELKISLRGGEDSDIYQPKFVYDSFYITPIDYDENKDYSVDYFGEVDNISCMEKYKDKLLVILNTLNYYELINTMDILARTDYIQQIYFNYIYVIPPIWEISDEEIVDVTINDDNSITIKALKSGAVNIKYDGIECNITINNK